MRARPLALAALTSAILACSTASPKVAEPPLGGEPLALRFTPRAGEALWVSGAFVPFEVELVGGPPEIRREHTSFSCTSTDAKGTHGATIWFGPPGAIAGERIERRWLLQPNTVPNDGVTSLRIACEARVHLAGSSGTVRASEVLTLPVFDRPTLGIARIEWKRCGPVSCAAVHLARTAPPGYARRDATVECAFAPSFGAPPSELEAARLDARFSMTTNVLADGDVAELPWRVPFGADAARSVHVTCRAREPSTSVVSERSIDVAGSPATPSTPIRIARIATTGKAAYACFGCDSPGNGRAAGYHVGFTYEATSAGTAFVQCVSGNDTLSTTISVTPQSAGKTGTAEAASPFPAHGEKLSAGTFAGPPLKTSDVRCRAFALPGFASSAEVSERVSFVKDD